MGVDRGIWKIRPAFLILLFHGSCFTTDTNDQTRIDHHHYQGHSTRHGSRCPYSSDYAITERLKLLSRPGAANITRHSFGPRSSQDAICSSL